MAPGNFEAFVELVYGAVGEPAYWQRLSDMLSATMGGAAQISAFAPRWDARLFCVPEFVPPEMIDKYQNLYAADDPRIPAATRSYMETPVACQDLVNVDSFERTALVNEFLDRPECNLRWCVAHMSHLDSDTKGLVSLMRPRQSGPYDQRETKAFGRLSGHIHRALRLHNDMASLDLGQRRLEATLDHLPEATFVCNRNGLIFYMNRAAARLLENDDRFCAKRGVLTLTHPAAARNLAGVLFETVEMSGDDTTDTPVILQGQNGALPLILRCHKLPCAPDMDSGTARGEVLILLRNPATSVLPDSAVLAALRFSGAEIALTLSLVEGKTLAEHAAERGISRETARTQLKSAMAKAGVSRQIDLVRLALRYAQ